MVDLVAQGLEIARLEKRVAYLEMMQIELIDSTAMLRELVSLHHDRLTLIEKNAAI